LQLTAHGLTLTDINKMTILEIGLWLEAAELNMVREKIDKLNDMPFFGLKIKNDFSLWKSELKKLVNKLKFIYRQPPSEAEIEKSWEKIRGR